MKKAILPAILCLAFVSANAQFDDIYFDPSQDKPAQTVATNYAGSNQLYAEDIEEYYDNDYQEGYDDYDYYYTARIRRFHRPMYGFNYFDPFYSDMWYYDPSMVRMAPGVTLLIHNNPWSYNRFRSLNYWNYRSWMNSPNLFWHDYGYGAFGYGRNYGFVSPYGGFGWGGRNLWNPYSGWGFGSFGGFYPTWGGGNTYIQNNQINIVDNSRTYFGRRGNTSNYLPRLNDGRRPEAATPTGGVRTNTSRTVAGSTLTAPRRQSTINSKPSDPNSRTRINSGQKLPTSAGTIYDRNRTISNSGNGNKAVGATRRTGNTQGVTSRNSMPRTNRLSNSNTRRPAGASSSSGVNRSSSAPSRSVSPPSRNSSSTTRSSSGGVRTSSIRGNN